MLDGYGLDYLGLMVILSELSHCGFLFLGKPIMGGISPISKVLQL